MISSAWQALEWGVLVEVYSNVLDVRLKRKEEKEAGGERQMLISNDRSDYGSNDSKLEISRRHAFLQHHLVESFLTRT